MELHNLKPAKNSIKKSKRIGRGQASGSGGTSGRGHNGAQSRSGYKQKINYEGGQNPLQMRLPKFGYMNTHNRTTFKPINLDIIQSIIEKKEITTINKETLVNCGLISKKDKVKVLGRGELKSKIELTVDSISATAKKSIESLGGTVKIDNKK